MTLADQIARDIEDAAREVGRIRALSRTSPHCFAEDKDAAERRLMTLASKVRTLFGGAPVRGETGLIPAPQGLGARLSTRRMIRVEARRRA